MAIGKWITVQYTDEEHGRIKAKAEKLGLSMAEYVRRVILSDAK